MHHPKGKEKRVEEVSVQRSKGKEKKPKSSTLTTDPNFLLILIFLIFIYSLLEGLLALFHKELLED